MSSGPSDEPCGTPHFTVRSIDEGDLLWTSWDRCLSWLRNTPLSEGAGEKIEKLDKEINRLSRLSDAVFLKHKQM